MPAARTVRANLQLQAGAKFWMISIWLYSNLRCLYIDYVINREDTKGMVESGSIKYQMVPPLRGAACSSGAGRVISTRPTAFQHVCEISLGRDKWNAAEGGRERDWETESESLPAPVSTLTVVEALSHAHIKNSEGEKVSHARHKTHRAAPDIAYRCYSCSKCLKMKVTDYISSNGGRQLAAVPSEESL